MKYLAPLPLLILAALAGCAGHVADYVGSRSSIVSPQLIRYGFDLAQARCVGERLGAARLPASCACSPEPPARFGRAITIPASSAFATWAGWRGRWTIAR